VYVVTGGNAGLGYFAAEQLAATGARVVLACRNAARAQAAKASIGRRVPGAYVDRMKLDLASLDSVRLAAEEIAELGRVDGLVLNGGTTTPPRRRETSADGHELVFATNYLGHFALLAQAWPALYAAEDARVVGVGSLATQVVRLDADDLQSERRYAPFRAYAFSKHAVHGLVFELARRLAAAGDGQRALLAHPGYAIDSLTSARDGVVAGRSGPARLAGVASVAAQGKNRGATSIVRALLDPEALNSTFFGPEHRTKGRPVPVQPVASSASPEFGRRLWERSEEWADVPFPL